MCLPFIILQLNPFLLVALSSPLFGVIVASEQQE
jgi:hypothetical protein